MTRTIWKASKENLCSIKLSKIPVIFKDLHRRIFNKILVTKTRPVFKKFKAKWTVFLLKSREDIFSFHPILIPGLSLGKLDTHPPHNSMRILEILQCQQILLESTIKFSWRKPLPYKNQSNDLMRFHEIYLNTLIYNLSSGPHITHFLAVVAKKRENFEYTFVLKRANIACRQKVTTVNLLQKLLNNFCNTQLQIGIISWYNCYQ